MMALSEEDGIADLLAFQEIRCGVDPNPFIEFPKESKFRDKETIRKEHGHHGQLHARNSKEMIRDCEVEKPYYLALIRKR